MPTQTPASRRFVLPSSTAPTHSQKQHTIGSQFTKPPHASSSPYTRTPFSSTAQKERRDDIIADDSEDEDADDDDNAQRNPPSHETVTIDLSHPLDSPTNDDDLSDGLKSPVPVAPTQFSQRPTSRGTQVHSNKRRKVSHPVSENIDDDLDLPSPPSSPTHSHDDDRRQSPEPEVHVSHTSPTRPSQDNNSPSPTSSTPNSPPHEFQTPKLHKSRFRDKLPSSTPAFDTTPQPIYPSFQSRLLASSTTSTSANVNPNPATTSPGPHIRGPRPTLDLTLPDAFSPSRKRGNREYMYGGIAETVRGWVVDMATMVAGHTAPTSNTYRSAAMQHGDDGSRTQIDDANLLDKDKIVVDKVLLIDPNGRFVLIDSKALLQAQAQAQAQASAPAHSTTSTLPSSKPDEHYTDTESAHEPSTWMLINTDPQSRRPNASISHSALDSHSHSHSHSRLHSVQPGTVIHVKGGDAMTWELNLDSNLNLDGKGSSDARAQRSSVRRKCKVAVLWDVISPT